MLLHPGDTIDFNGEKLVFPDIRLVYWAGGNPFHHHQDLNRLLLAWRRPETVVVHEPFWNALARHADIVLPATTTLERNDIACANRDNFIVAMKKAIEPVAEARSDFDIFSDLAERLNASRSFTEMRGEMDWIRHLYEQGRNKASMPMPPFEEFWRLGSVALERTIKSHVLLANFRRDPQACRLATPSGLIELFSSTIASFGYGDCLGYPAWFEPMEWLGSSRAVTHPIHLLSCQPSGKLHSQYDHGSASLEGKIAGRAPIYLHRDDAERRGIGQGDIVRVFNDRGACLAGAVVGDGILPGVAQMATGAWYDPVEPGTPGSLEKQGNPNVLTPDKGASRLSQAPIPNSTLVQVELFREMPPNITAFQSPL
jgi:biotin/methionine sulfoxide reductase